MTPTEHTEQAQALISDIKVNTHSTAEVTVVSLLGVVKCQLARNGDSVAVVGCTETELADALHTACVGGGGLVLRSACDERDQRTDMVVNELRGYVLGPDVAGGWSQLSAAANKVAHSLDADTGESLASEPAVIYR
jgi:hypothetical protein